MPNQGPFPGVASIQAVERRAISGVEEREDIERNATARRGTGRSSGFRSFRLAVAKVLIACKPMNTQGVALVLFQVRDLDDS